MIVGIDQFTYGLKFGMIIFTNLANKLVHHIARFKKQQQQQQQQHQQQQQQQQQQINIINDDFPKIQWFSVRFPITIWESGRSILKTNIHVPSASITFSFWGYKNKTLSFSTLWLCQNSYWKWP